MSNVNDIQKVAQQIGRLNDNAEGVAKALASDFAKRAPAWINKPVVARYNIKAKDFKATIKKTNAQKSMIAGKPVDAVAFAISSGRLYPSANRFSMTPKQPKKANVIRKRKGNKSPYTVQTGNYKLYATILKGKKVQIGEYTNRKPSGKGVAGSSGVILMRMPGGYLPFQRKGDQLYKFNSLSTGQMVYNEDVSKEINELIEENMLKRYEHYKKRLTK